MMKRQAKSKSNPLLSNKTKSSFHALLDSTLTPKGRNSNLNVNRHHQSGQPGDDTDIDIRDESPKRGNPLALDSNRLLYEASSRRDGIDGDNENVQNGNARNGHGGTNISRRRRRSSTTTNSSIPSTSSAKSSISITPLYKECLNLYKAKQYRSAELLAMFNLTSLGPSSSHKAHALELVADCAFHQSQYLRASSYYKQAFEHCLHDPFNSRGSTSASGINFPLSGSNGSNGVAMSSVQAQLKHKESNCVLLSGNVLEASSLLESSIPIRSPYRTYAISMDLGRMYMDLGRVNDARRCFIDVLNKNIYALEAIECLAKLGSEKSAVSKIVQQKLSCIQQRQQQQQQQQAASDKMGDSKENLYFTKDTMRMETGTGSILKKMPRPSLLLPINEIINATFYSCTGSSHALHAWNYWSKLLDQHPNHTYLLLQMARLQSRYPFLLGTAGGMSTNSSSSDGSSSCIFAKIRNIDPYFVGGMDTYALILAKQQNKSELGRLCSELLEVDDKRHETWAALALYHHTCGDVEKSLAFLEKGIACNPRSAFCHQVMGGILQGEGRLDHAIVSYFRANEISKDVISYEGLVEAYLSCSKYKEAVCTAKEAISFAPRDPRAMTLVGLALMSAPGSRERGRDKAKRTLKKAFSIDPTCKKALFALVDLHIEEEEYDICVESIKRAIDESDGFGSSSSNTNSIDKLYSKMAEVYKLSKKYSDALESFHKALAINPNSVEAQCGMEELEKIMKYADTHTSSASTSHSHSQHIHSAVSSEDYHYQSRRNAHQNHSYRYGESELDSVVRAI